MNHREWHERELQRNPEYAEASRVLDLQDAQAMRVVVRAWLEARLAELPYMAFHDLRHRLDVYDGKSPVAMEKARAAIREVLLGLGGERGPNDR